MSQSKEDKIIELGYALDRLADDFCKYSGLQVNSEARLLIEEHRRRVAPQRPKDYADDGYMGCG